ncbi:MAG TPA: AMP-binding protein [Acidimicrobiales bacterium]|nr:AMP-binding protein [Acidimicrobiales bacterium]
MNLADIVEGHPDEAVALVASDRTLTYGQLRAEVGAARGGLVRLGVRPDDRVALVLPNGWPFVVAYLAVLGVGAVAVPIDPSMPAPAVAQEIDMIRARVAIAGPAAEAVVREVAQGRSGATQLVVVGDMSELLDADPVPYVDRRPDDLALLVFTAGTAGPAKAAMLTHGGLRANLDQVQQHPGRALVPNDVSYGVLPFFHVFGINVVLGLSLLAGSSVVLVERFDAAEALAIIRERRVTILAGAPPMFRALAAASPGEGSGRGDGDGPPGGDLASVRLAVSGASALPPEVAAAFEDRFGLPLWQGYGLTEASPVVTSSVIGGVPKPGSVGVPLPGVKLRLVDEAGEDALVSDPGELWVKGPNVFAGYWEDPEATAAVLTDGWLHTGDVAVVDDDGYVYLVDRLKDIVIVSGFNVYPAEVEDVLRDDPRVDEVAVVGVADAHTGESVRAYVVATADAAGDPGLVDTLAARCRAHLAPYECPDAIEIVDSLPHGLGGKLLRRALRQGSTGPPR